MLSHLVPAVAGLFVFPTTGPSECPKSWALTASRDQQRLELNIREQGQQGPACDLVVQSFDYDETLGLLALSVQPSRVCPVDALAERQALFSWNLPQDLRGQADLLVIVNGEMWGAVHLRGDKVSVEGDCP